MTIPYIFVILVLGKFKEENKWKKTIVSDASGAEKCFRKREKQKYHGGDNVFRPRRVSIESPFFTGDIEKNIRYTQACLLDSLKRGEAPIASHLLYTQVLNDNNPQERSCGIKAGFEWNKFAEATVVYVDLGITVGMRLGIEEAKKKGRVVEYRNLPSDLIEKLRLKKEGVGLWQF